MVSALVPGSSGPGSNPGRGTLGCVLGQDTLLSQCWGVTCDGQASRPGGVEILLAASCYGNQDKLWPEEPVFDPKASEQCSRRKELRHRTWPIKTVWPGCLIGKRRKLSACRFVIFRNTFRNSFFAIEHLLKFFGCYFVHHPTTVKKIKTMKTYKYELGNWIPKVYLESWVIRLEDEIFFPHIIPVCFHF